jgi:hypothetical protein
VKSIARDFSGDQKYKNKTRNTTSGRKKISKDASAINESMTSEGTTTQNSHFDSSFCTTHLTSVTRI